MASALKIKCPALVATKLFSKDLYLFKGEFKVFLVLECDIQLGTIFPGVADLVAIAADKELIIVYYSAPFTAYLQQIWHRR